MDFEACQTGSRSAKCRKRRERTCVQALNRYEELIEYVHSGESMNTIKKIHIDNVTVFNNLNISPVNGINVVSGTNSTGKTHFLKILYCIHEILRTVNERHVENKELFAEHVTTTIIENFMIDSIGRLSSRVQGHKHSRISALFPDNSNNKKEMVIDFSTRKKIVDVQTVHQEYNVKDALLEAIFIPSREILSDISGLLGGYHLGQIETEAFNVKLAAFLAVNSKSGRTPAEIRTYLEELEKILDAKIDYDQEKQKFFIYQPGLGTIEMGLAADGHKKIGMLMQLIKNGAVTNNEVLFIDEPEASMNPSFAKPYIRLLYKLAQNGNQLFVSTHDYFFLKYMDLVKDEFKDTPIQFINLYRKNKKDKFAEYEVGESVYDLDHNAVFREFEKIHEETMKQFWN